MKAYIKPQLWQVAMTLERTILTTSRYIPITGEGTGETAPGHGDGGSLSDTRQFEFDPDFWD